MKTRLNLSVGAFVRFGALGLAAVVSAGSPAMAGFNYSDFSSTSGLTLAGAATVTGNTIAVTPSEAQVAGGVWYTDSKQNVAGGFTTDFAVRVYNKQGQGADGFAFVIQNSAPAPLGGAGGAIGYASNVWYGQTGIPNSLAVELDLWNNSGRGWDDYPQYPIKTSIQTNGLLPNQPDQEHSLGAAPIPNVGDGQVHNVRITYAGGMMSVYVDDLTTPVLTQAVNLSSILSLDNGTAWVGITAATGGATDEQAQELRSWSFSGGDIPSPTGAAVLGLGGLAVLRRRR